MRSGLAFDRALLTYERVKLTAHPQDRIALDRSLRTLSPDGHLHVGLSNISKAVVNPYWGAEIPDGENLGLEPKQQYFLWRHPQELEKAAPSFNNLQILADHVPVTADAHKPELVVGSTGTDAVYQHPYLKNTLVFWTKPAIDAIQSGNQRELSCAYHYVPVMQPGTTPEGLHYDGIMTRLVGNHVALVEDGRAGSDVLVHDAMPQDMRDQQWRAIANAIRRI
jgi:hypothetical protein